MNKGNTGFEEVPIMVFSRNL